MRGPRGRARVGLAAALTLLCCLLPGATPAEAEASAEDGRITVVPQSFQGPLRNPLMGITARELGVHEWGTLTHHYIGWRELECVETDGVDKIVDYCNAAWRDFPQKNIKVIPRIFLEYPGRPHAWPEGLAEGDYSSPEFARRLELFVAKLGQAWNADPRVAFIELGLFGKWGEHHSPPPSQEIQRVAGTAFARAFPDKRVSVRRVWETFSGTGFGEYWDSYAHWDEMPTNGRPIADFNRETKLYQRNYIGGEVAYDWGNWRIQPGESPTSSLAEPAHLAYVLNTVRWLQCTQLRWIGDYDRSDPRAVAGAARLQNALGYKFELESVSYTSAVQEGGRLRIDLAVRNVGTAPFYYRWPLEVALLDEESRAVVWREVFAAVDVRTWLPGHSVITPSWTAPEGDEPARAIWPAGEIAEWSEPSATHLVSQTFVPSVPKGRYVLALAILDPAGMRPAVCFATRQYWRGGRHPIGLVGFGGESGGVLPGTMPFDDQFSDQTLGYEPGVLTVPRATQREE